MFVPRTQTSNPSSPAKLPPPRTRLPSTRAASNPHPNTSDASCLAELDSNCFISPQSRLPRRDRTRLPDSYIQPHTRTQWPAAPRCPPSAQPDGFSKSATSPMIWSRKSWRTLASQCAMSSSGSTSTWPTCSPTTDSMSRLPLKARTTLTKE